MFGSQHPQGSFPLYVTEFQRILYPLLVSMSFRYAVYKIYIQAKNTHACKKERKEYREVDAGSVDHFPSKQGAMHPS